mgnify:CR=1 FL=1
MDLGFLMDMPELPSWRVLKNEIIPRNKTFLWKKERALGSYNLVHVLVDEKGEFKTFKANDYDTISYFAFSDPELVKRMGNTYDLDESITLLEEGTFAKEFEGCTLRTMMTGELVNTLSREGRETSIKINPVPVKIGEGVEPLIYAEEVLFAPQYDSFTSKRLLTSPDDAKALLAINPDDEKRFGIEIVYYLLTNRDLPEEGEERNEGLKNKIEELAFKAPRIPIKRGSASFIAVLLNLENEIEERAFIRDYSTFDTYSDLVFVTSSLKIWTGKLEEILFNGERIDTIFSPLIKWQQGKKKRTPYFHNN